MQTVSLKEDTEGDGMKESTDTSKGGGYIKVVALDGNLGYVIIVADDPVAVCVSEGHARVFAACVAMIGENESVRNLCQKTIDRFFKASERN